MDCVRQLGELKREAERRSPGSVVVAISIDSVAEAEALIDEVAADAGTDPLPDGTVLADPGHHVIDRYGLLEPGGEGWARPTALIVDRRGVVRWKRIEPTEVARPANDEVLAALDALRPG